MPAWFHRKFWKHTQTITRVASLSLMGGVQLNVVRSCSCDKIFVYPMDDSPEWDDVVDNFIKSEVSHG